MTRTFVLTILMLWFTIFSFTSREAVDNEALNKESWRKLNLQLSLVQQVLNAPSCQANSTRFLGCIKTFNYLLGHDHENSFLATPPLIQIINAELSQKEKRAHVVVKNDLGYYKIVFIENANGSGAAPALINTADRKTLVENYQEEKRKQLAQEEYWKSVQVKLREPDSIEQALPYRDLLNYIAENNLKPENTSEIIGAAFNLFTVIAVDAHGSIMPKEIWDRELQASEQKYEGIGVLYSTLDRQIVVTQPIEGSPAFRAGVSTNDVILAVDDFDIEAAMRNGDPNEVSAKARKIIRGISGTSVRVRVRHGTQVRELRLKRAEIVQKNISSKVITFESAVDHHSHHLGYLKISSFQRENLTAQIKEELVELLAQGVDSLAIDIRNNSGGLLNEVVNTAGLFVGKDKVIVTEKSVNVTSQRGSRRSEGPCRDLGVDLVCKTETEKITNLPMVVLINSQSASASEIFSGALQDYHRAVIVGERSWGKGTVLTVFRPNIISPVMVTQTSAVFYLPGNESKKPHTNQIAGITPDVEVYQAPHPTEEDKFALREADLSPIILKVPAMNERLANPDVKTEPLSNGIKYSRACLDETGQAEQIYEKNKNAQMPRDFQLYKALDVAACQVAPALLKYAQHEPAIKRPHERHHRSQI